MKDKKILAVYCSNLGLELLDKKDIKALDVLYISFGYVNNGRVTIDNLTNINRINEIRQINPSIKILLSLICGKDGGFFEACKSDDSMDLLVDDAVKKVTEYGFDGLDIDWEFPTIKGDESEKHKHTQLLRKFRNALDKIGKTKRYLLTIAAGSKSWYFTITELSDSVKYLDYVNIMTYDINANSEFTVHHSCPYAMNYPGTEEGSTQENIEIFHKNGVPMDKIIIGAAFYGRKWDNVPNINNGLYAPVENPSTYAPEYTKLIDNYVNKNGYIRYWDDTAKAPYLFNGSTFITYDDKESLRYKCQLVREYDIAGIMGWNYQHDENHELLAVMRESLDLKG